MGGLISALQLILSLSLLVFIHELGHFLAARAFNIRVDKFFIFFDAWGKKLWSKKVGDTEYGIGWLPLGGYVKIAGMVDESMDTEQLKQEPQPWEFRSKPAWQRFIVMIGGIVMNILAGIIIFAFYLKNYEKEYLPASALKNGIYAFEGGEKLGFQTGDKLVAINGKSRERYKDYTSMEMLFGADVAVERKGEIVHIQLPDTLFQTKGTDYFAPFHHKIQVAAVADSSNAQKAGLKDSDFIVAVNGKILENYGDLRTALQAAKDTVVSLDIEREGKMQSLNCSVDTAGKIGFYPFFDYKAVNATHPYGLAESMRYGIKEGWDAIYYNAKGFAMMFQGKLNPATSVQSPIGMAKYFGPKWNWQRFWYLTGLLSFILAFMNILPIPALDGGHMMFIGVEAITGRRLSDSFLEKAQMVGMAILLPLMLFAVGKDLWEIISNFLFK